MRDEIKDSVPRARYNRRKMDLILKLLVAFAMTIVGAAVLIGVMALFNMIGIPPIESGFGLLIAAIVFAIDDHSATQSQVIARQTQVLEELAVHLRGDRAHLYTTKYEDSH